MMITRSDRRLSWLLGLGSFAGKIGWGHQHRGVAVDFQFVAVVRLAAIPGRRPTLATGRTVLAHTGGRQHVGTHHGAISDLATLEIAGIVQIWECAGGLLGESRQARQLAQDCLLALVQQLGLTTQLLLPPCELLLGPLVDCGGLLLGGGDARLGLLGSSILGLLGFDESLGPNPGSFS